MSDLTTVPSLNGLTRAYNRLRWELAGLTDEELRAFRVEGWPRHPHWAGEDGSIGGILHHVTAWKEALALALEGYSPVDPTTLGHSGDDAAAMLSWLQQSHERMLAALRPYLPPGHRSWPDHPLLEGLNLERTLEVWLDHDRYHAAQVAYLRQRFIALNPSQASKGPGEST